MSIYLDNSATSFPKPECVYAAIEAYMRGNGASPGRGNYEKAMAAEKLVYETRKSLAALIGAQKPSEIVFTQNATEAINTVIKGYLRPGDTVLTSNIEHNAVWRPLKKLERDQGIKVNCFHVSPEGEVDLDEIAELLDGDGAGSADNGTAGPGTAGGTRAPDDTASCTGAGDAGAGDAGAGGTGAGGAGAGKTGGAGPRPPIRLCVFVHGSNVLGNILPLDQITRLAHAAGAAVLVDASQTAGVYPLDVAHDGVDFLAFTGHKGLLGPTGTGGFYMRSGMQLNTLKEGGTGSMASSPFQPELPPDRFEAGTMNIFGLAGLKAAVDYLRDFGVANILAHERRLCARLIEGLASLPGAEYYGSRAPNQKTGVVAFNLEAQDPFKVAAALDGEYGIMVRAGLHCAPQAHRVLGTAERGALRASIGPFNTDEQIDQLLAALQGLSQRDLG